METQKFWTTSSWRRQNSPSSLCPSELKIFIIFSFLCSFKVEKKLFRIKNYEISGFCCLKEKNFYSNYDNAQRPKDGRGTIAMKMGKWSIMLLSLWKKFFIYRRMMCSLRCCFVLSDIIVVMGCLVIELKMLFLLFLVVASFNIEFSNVFPSFLEY